MPTNTIAKLNGHYIFNKENEMKKEISSLDFLYDLREVSRLSDDAICKMYDYMEENYDVQNYQPKIIAKKFGEFSMEELRLDNIYDINKYCCDNEMSASNITDQDVIEAIEETQRWKLVCKLDNGKYLFDLDYYNVLWENY